MKQHVYVFQLGEQNQQKIEQFSNQGFQVQSFNAVSECWKQMQEEKPVILALPNEKDSRSQELAQEVRMSEWMDDVSIVYWGE